MKSNAPDLARRAGETNHPDEGLSAVVAPQGGAVRVLERLGVLPADVEEALAQALARAS